MIVNEYRYGNAVITVYRPELDEKERASRERKILAALQQVGKLMVEGESSNGNGCTSRDICKK